MTNVNNKIIGVGEIGNSHFAINNQSSGVIDGNGTAVHLELAANVTNAGLIEGTTSQGLFIDSGHPHKLRDHRSAWHQRLGGDHQRNRHQRHEESSDSRFRQWGAGGSRTETISGGTLKTSAGGTIAARFGTLSGVTIAPSSLIEVTNVTLSGGTIGAGAVVETNGGAVFVGGTVSNGGTLFANSAGDEVAIMPAPWSTAASP